MPDLCHGMGGWAGTAPVPLPMTVGFQQQSYDDPQMNASFPHGVYTAHTDSPEPVTFTIGGATLSITNGQGNIKPRQAVTGVTVTGPASARFAVNLCPGGQMWSSDVVSGTADGMLGADPRATIGEAWTFVAHKLFIDGRVETTVSLTNDVWRGSAANSFPAVPARFDRRGLYRMQFFSLTGLKDKPMHVFDVRTFHEEISDADLLRVRDNGAAELRRLGFQP